MFNVHFVNANGHHLNWPCAARTAKEACWLSALGYRGRNARKLEPRGRGWYDGKYTYHATEQPAEILTSHS